MSLSLSDPYSHDPTLAVPTGSEKTKLNYFARIESVTIRFAPDCYNKSSFVRQLALKSDSWQLIQSIK